MKAKSLIATTVMLVAAFYAWGADTARDWKSGTLLETEKQEVTQGTTKHTTTEGRVKDKGKKTDYSQTSRSTTTDNTDIFQVYTIDAGGKTYIARERLLFPWSKPANVAVGEPVKYAVEKNTLYLLDSDGKQHKAGISKVSMNQSH